MSVIDLTSYALLRGARRHPMPQVDDVLSLYQEHSDRLERYRDNWLHYKGRHWSRERSMDEPLITVNYIRPLADALTNILFKKEFQIQVPSGSASADLQMRGKEVDNRFFLKLRLDQYWTWSQRKLFGIELGQTGAVTGDAFIHVGWEEEDPIAGQPYARADVLPSHFVFPEFSGDDGYDRKRMTACLIMWPYYEMSGDPANRKRKRDLIMRSIRYTKDRIVEYVGDREVRNEPNALGEIPVVHIPNYPVAGEFYGVADVSDVVPLQDEYNEKMTDISDVISYHSSPVTYMIGAKPGDLERGPNRIWSIPEGSSIGNLQLSGDLTAAVNHVERLKTAMHELTSVPEFYLGKDKPTSNTPGVALRIQLLPLMDRREIKTMVYGLGLQQVNRLMIKLAEIKDTAFKAQLDKLEGNKYLTEIVFPDPLPQDEKSQLDLSMARIEGGFSSRRAELEKMGHSKDDIEQILKEGVEEQQRLSDELFNGGAGTRPKVGARGSDFQRGESASRAAEDRL